MPLVIIAVVRVLAYAALTYGVFRLYTLAARRSPILGGLLAAGLILRAVLGAVLFLISYFRWPLFESMQLGGGFWTLALDGRWYFDAASQAVISGIGSVSDGSASPFYVRALAIWMQVFGVTPLSAVVLNVACYAGCAGLIALIATDTRPAIISLLSFTCSPALVIFGTQPLKDTLCALLITMALAGISLWMRGLDAARFSWRKLAIAVVLLAASVYGVAGIRAYLAVFILAGYVAVVVWSIFAVVIRRERWELFGAQVTLGFMLWVAFASGAGAYYQSYRDILLRSINAPLQPFAELEVARAGFARTQGATSLLTSPMQTGATSPVEVLSSSDRLARAPKIGLTGRMENLVLGSAVLFVPISMLKGMSIVTFPGGRGLLYVTDIDTMVMDAGIFASLFMIASGAAGRRSPAVAIFALVLAMVTTVALAYVVTNFGTMFRLRLIVAVPLWILPAFVSLGNERDVRAQAL